MIRSVPDGGEGITQVRSLPFVITGVGVESLADGAQVVGALHTVGFVLGFGQGGEQQAGQFFRLLKVSPWGIVSFAVDLRDFRQLNFDLHLEAIL